MLDIVLESAIVLGMKDKSNSEAVVNFKEFEKELKGIRYRSIADWEILMPFNTKPEMLQRVIQKCRDFLLIDWHVIISDPTEENPEPELRMYWDRMNIH
jgi:hypothetical protein